MDGEVEEPETTFRELSRGRGFRIGTMVLGLGVFSAAYLAIRNRGISVALVLVAMVPVTSTTTRGVPCAM